MLRESGRVVSVDGKYALVSSGRKKLCGDCHGGSSCNTLSMGLGDKLSQIRAINKANARVGDQVTLEISEGFFLKASFLVYAGPVIVLMLVGVGVRHLLLTMGMDPYPAEGLSAISGLIAMGVAFASLRRVNRVLEGRDDALPVISRVEPSPAFTVSPPTSLKGE